MSGLCEYKPGARIPESGAGSGSKDVQIQFQSGYKSEKVISLLVRSSFLF